MALNIKDAATEQLATELATLTGTSKTGAVRSALREALDRRRAEVQGSRRSDRLTRFLQDEAWPQIPVEVLGHPLGKSEREALLGYGPDGV